MLNAKSDRGFTLIELIIVLIIIGVAAAIATPNFFALLSRFHVNSSLERLLGGIREAQQQAMRQKKLCRININTNTNTLTGNPNNCLLNNRELEDNINIRTNLSGAIPNISFSSKGTTTKMGTIVLSTEGTALQRCFVISLGLGIMRTGKYTGSKTGSVSASKCQKM